MEKPFRGTVPPDLKLIETLALHPGEPLRHPALHLDRMQAGARDLGISFDRAEAEAALCAVVPDGPTRLRATLDRTGRFQIATAPLAPAPETWNVVIAAAPIDAGDPWRRVKSTRREVYDRTRAHLPEGVDEAIFLNMTGALAEGTITNLYVERDGTLLTPPLTSGALPGTMRRAMIAAGRAQEATLTPADLREGRLYLSNALRGLIPARLIPPDTGLG